MDDPKWSWYANRGSSPNLIDYLYENRADPEYGEIINRYFECVRKYYTHLFNVNPTVVADQIPPVADWQPLFKFRDKILPAFLDMTNHIPGGFYHSFYATRLNIIISKLSEK